METPIKRENCGPKCSLAIPNVRRTQSAVTAGFLNSACGQGQVGCRVSELYKLDFLFILVDLFVLFLVSVLFLFLLLFCFCFCFSFSFCFCFCFCFVQLLVCQCFLLVLVLFCVCFVCVVVLFVSVIVCFNVRPNPICYLLYFKVCCCRISMISLL